VLTIKKFIETYTATINENASKVVVRELDEVSKNNYEAYVDVGNETYDVVVLINKETIAHAQCDCKNNKAFCVHKVMVVHSILQKQKGTTTKIKIAKVKKVKLSAAMQLLEDIDNIELKKWLVGLFEKNKSIEVEFVNTFSQNKEALTVKLVIEKLKESVKAVVGVRKNIEQNELKKIVDLWSITGKSVAEFCIHDLTDLSRLEVLFALHDYCLMYDRSLKITSKKISNYIAVINNKLIEPINALANKEHFEKCVDFFIKGAVQKNRFEWMSNLQILFQVAEIATEERKQTIISKLYEFTKTNVASNTVSLQDSFFIFFLDNVVKHKLFYKYNDIFKPLHFQNVYNSTLIDALIEIKEYERTEKYCKAQIARNYNIEYNVYYWDCLKRIYSIANQHEKYLSVIKDALPFSLNLEDYLAVYPTVPKDELQKWRVGLTNRAKSRFNSFNCVKFYYGVYANENKYSKIIADYQFRDYPEIVLKYAENFISNHKASFFNFMTDNFNSVYSHKFENNENVSVVFDELFNIVIKHYAKQDLKVHFLALLKRPYTQLKINPYLQKMFLYLNIEYKK
jgi:hypothetical protein